MVWKTDTVRKWEKEKKEEEAKTKKEETKRAKELSEVPEKWRFQPTSRKDLKKVPATEGKKSSWNQGLRRQTQPSGTYVKRQIDSTGRENVEHAKIEPEPEKKPKQDIDRARYEHQRKVSKTGLGLKDKPKDEPVQINRNIGNYIDSLDLILEHGSKEELEDSSSKLGELLHKYGHTSLADKLPLHPTNENLKAAISEINKRRGIAETTGPRLPHLVPGRITRKDGAVQTVYHMPTVGKKKLKIRPGFSKETLVREHGHEGHEGEIVTQTMWKKDKDFTKKGVINMDEWEYNPDKGVVGIEGVEYTEHDKGVPSSIVDYGDDFRAFVKYDEPKNLRREYGISKFFNTSELASSMGFTIPRSNIIDVDKLSDKSIAESVGATEGQVIHNEFVDGYPLSIIHDSELFDKIDKQDMADAVVFNKLIGNKSFDMNNILVDEDGKLTLVDNINTLNSALDVENEIYELTFDEWQLVDEELLKNSFEKIRGMDFDDIIYGILQNTQVDDSEYEKYENTLRENFELLNTHLHGDEEEIETLQRWWDKEREGRVQLELEDEQDEARGTLQELKEDELKQAFMDTIRGKTERVDEIMTALEDRVRERIEEDVRTDLERKIRLELKEKYDLVPKETEEEIDVPEYTMEDLFLENQNRREQGLPAFQSVDEMADYLKEHKVEDEPEDTKEKFKWKLTPVDNTLFLDSDEEPEDMYKERREEIKDYYINNHIQEDENLEIDFVDDSDDYVKVLNYDTELDRYIFDIDADEETRKQVLAESEKLIGFSEYEKLVVFDDTGKKIYTSNTDERSKITIEPDDVHYLEGGTLVHNHPSDHSCGSTFSKSDISVLIGHNAKELLVTTIMGGETLLYSIKPPMGGWEENSKSMVENAYDDEYNKFYEENDYNFDLNAVKDQTESEQASDVLEHTMQFIADKFGMRYSVEKLPKGD